MSNQEQKQQIIFAIKSLDIHNTYPDGICEIIDSHTSLELKIFTIEQVLNSMSNTTKNKLEVKMKELTSDLQLIRTKNNEMRELNANIMRINFHLLSMINAKITELEISKKISKSISDKLKNRCEAIKDYFNIINEKINDVINTCEHLISIPDMMNFTVKHKKALDILQEKFITCKLNDFQQKLSQEGKCQLYNDDNTFILLLNKKSVQFEDHFNALGIKPHGMNMENTLYLEQIKSVDPKLRVIGKFGDKLMRTIIDAIKKTNSYKYIFLYPSTSYGINTTQIDETIVENLKQLINYVYSKTSNKVNKRIDLNNEYWFTYPVRINAENINDQLLPVIKLLYDNNIERLHLPEALSFDNLNNDNKIKLWKLLKVIVMIHNQSLLIEKIYMRDGYQIVDNCTNPDYQNRIMFNPQTRPEEQFIDYDIIDDTSILDCLKNDRITIPKYISDGIKYKLMYASVDDIERHLQDDRFTEYHILIKNKYLKYKQKYNELKEKINGNYQ